jgi:aryl-alcohol dehydrogenase-like predicted oxidoreductase
LSHQNSFGIPLRPLGQTGVDVTAIGFGGYHLGLVKEENDAIRLLHESIDAGITFLDNAWEYHAGRSEELMGKAIHDRRDKVFLMTKVCTHGRDRHVAMRHLEDSLRRLKTDYLDLWQVHEVVYDNEPEMHFAEGGVIEALEQARSEGKVRFIGFTGHKSPEIHLKMLSYDYPFDTCQLPLNCFDATFRSFERQVLPELERRGIAAIGMKSLGGEGDMVRAGAVTAEEALRYAMSLPVATIVSGIDSPAVLRQNLGVARNFTPMSDDEMRQLRERCAAMAGDGRFEQFKTTLKFEGPVGREQHGFPPQNELKM